MLTIHLLGHAHLSRSGQPVPVSAKAVALITYLSIEKLPQHRERLADLLWTTAEARKNLRVELARIRTAGLNLFPASRQLLYLENVTTDFDLWQARAEQEMNQAQLSDWLAMLRGFPLSGLEDLGSSTFKEWVDQQRWILGQQVEEGLSRVYWRYARNEQAWALRLIAARADTLGFELTTEAPGDLGSSAPPATRATGTPVPEPVGASELHFERPREEQLLRQALLEAERTPQVVMLHGPPGIGKSYHAERVAAHSGWLTVRVADTRSSRLVLASLAQAALRESEAGGAEAEALRRLLLAPTSLEEDTVKVAVALARIGRPLLLVFDHVHDAPAELAPLLTFLMQVPGEGPRALLLLSRQRAAQAPLTRALRGQVSSAWRELELPPLTQASVQRTLEARSRAQPTRTLHSEAARLVQRSEGNPLHLLSVLRPAGEPGGGQDIHFPQAVRDSYGVDIDRWPPALMEAMIRLSAIYGHFDRRLAQAALGEGLSTSTDTLLYEALERHILREVEAEGTLSLPDLTLRPTPQGAETLYAFASEGLRIALASRSPQLIRQDVRRRLVPVLAEGAPGLAAYYARRGGLPEEAERLHRLYRAGLEGRQLRDIQAHEGPAFPVPEPRRVTAPLRGPAAAQGYLVSFDDNSWLNICSVGRYGHPQTLRLHLPLPAGEGTAGELRLVWRLDVFSSGEELGPVQLPFPLRVSLPGSGTAHVLTQAATPDYLEEGVRHVVHADVLPGQWQEHRLSFPEAAAGGTLELSVRALDVALTLGTLSWQGQNLLSALPGSVLPAAPVPGEPPSALAPAVADRPLLRQGR